MCFNHNDGQTCQLSNVEVSLLSSDFSVTEEHNRQNEFLFLGSVLNSNVTIQANQIVVVFVLGKSPWPWRTPPQLHLLIGQAQIPTVALPLQASWAPLPPYPRLLIANLTRASPCFLMGPL